MGDKKLGTPWESRQMLKSPENAKIEMVRERGLLSGIQIACDVACYRHNIQLIRNNIQIVGSVNIYHHLNNHMFKCNSKKILVSLQVLMGSL